MPPIPGQEIVLKYVSYEGKVTYRTVQTDANGCYEDLMVTVPENERQTVYVEFPGAKCHAPAAAAPVTAIWPPVLLMFGNYTGFGFPTDMSVVWDAFMLAVPWKDVLSDAYPGRNIPLSVYECMFSLLLLAPDVRSMDYNLDQARFLFR